MSYFPEPWKRVHEDAGYEDVEIAEEMNYMEGLEPPYEPANTPHASIFRRYWEKLLRNNNR